MNLVKLYTVHGALWVDTAQLNGGRLHCLTIYTRTGRKLRDTARTKDAREDASYGVHPENLFATPELAAVNMERILADIYKTSRAVQP